MDRKALIKKWTPSPVTLILLGLIVWLWFRPLADASMAAAFGTVSSVPTAFIVDAAGHIRHKIAGQVSPPRLEKLVTPLLGASAHPGPP